MARLPRPRCLPSRTYVRSTFHWRGLTFEKIAPPTGKSVSPRRREKRAAGLPSDRHQNPLIIPDVHPNDSKRAETKYMSHSFFLYSFREIGRSVKVAFIRIRTFLLLLNRLDSVRVGAGAVRLYVVVIRNATIEGMGWKWGVWVGP